MAAPVTGARKARSQSSDVLPKVFKRRGWYAADFRRWGEGRLTLRDPDAPTWPAGGERTADREVATRWVMQYLDLYRTQARQRHLNLGPMPKRLGAAADAYLEIRRRIRAYNTWKVNRTGLNHLRDHLGEEFSTDRLTTPILQRFFDDLHHEGYAPQSLWSIRESVSGFLRYLGQGKTTTANGVDLPPLIHDDVATWEPDELDLLRSSADELDAEFGEFQQHRRALELDLNSGARKNELFALKWEQIRPSSKTIRITHQLGPTSKEFVQLKGKLSRTALLLPGWWEWHVEGSRGVILTNVRGELLSPHQRLQVRINLLERAGLYRPGLGWHIDRHTYARDFIVEGGRYQELQRSLGHKSITTTEQQYGHFGEDIAAELARRRIYREEPMRVVR